MTSDLAAFGALWSFPGPIMVDVLLINPGFIQMCRDELAPISC